MTRNTNNLMHTFTGSDNPINSSLAKDFAGEGLDASPDKMAERTLGKRGGEILSGTIGLLWSVTSGAIDDKVAASKK